MHDLVPRLDVTFCHHLHCAHSDSVLPILSGAAINELEFIYLCRACNFILVCDEFEEKVCATCLNVYALLLLIFVRVSVREVRVVLNSAIFSEKNCNVIPHVGLFIKVGRGAELDHW